MVQLHLTSSKQANASSRYFPHHGYLGLTPLTVEGIVRTKLDEDRKPLPAKSISISVRCYESRVSRSRGTTADSLLVDYTDLLWFKPPTAEWADVAELELPFKITLPKRVNGLSTANFQVYRTFWRVEAILEHIPITGVGHRLYRAYDLPLVRYDVPRSVPSSPPSPPHSLHLQTTKHRAPVIRYNMSTPAHPVGPNDILFASLFLQPLDPGVAIRSATLTVERRIDLLNPPASSPPAASSPPPTPSLDPYFGADEPSTPNSSSSQLSTTSPSASVSSFPSAIDLTASSSSSVATIDSTTSSTRPLLYPLPTPPAAPTTTTSPTSYLPPDTPAKTLTSIVVSTEATGFTPDASGIWSKTLTLQWPAARPQSRWALGETMASEHATVRFFLRAAVRVVGPAGNDVVELEPREIVVAATSEAERRMALARWVDVREGTGRSKSKSPWRARHGHADTREGEGGDGDEDAEEVRAAARAQAKSYPGTSTGSSGSVQEDARAQHQHQHQHHKGGMSHSGFGAKGKAYLKAARRPHTSAGPRDKSNFDFEAASDGRMAPLGAGEGEGQGRASRHERDRTGVKGHGHVRRESGLGESLLPVVHKDREREKEKRARACDGGQGAQADHVRAWEEELARIELQSRRSSAHMLGSWGLPFVRRKQVLQRG